MHIALDEDENVQSFSFYNKSIPAEARLDKKKETLAISAHLMVNGDSKSTEIMSRNPVREYDFDEEYEIGDNKFRKATVSLRDKINMEFYTLEQNYKKSAENISITHIALQLHGTVKALYKKGYAKYKN